MGTLAHAGQAVKGAFPQPLRPGVTLLRSLQAGAAWVRWREADGRPSPYLPLVQGQALLHAEGMGTVDWAAIVPDTAFRWITVASPQRVRSQPACHRLLWAAPYHAFTREVWRATLSHTREWMTNPRAWYPPGTVLEQLTARTPGVRHALHRASALRNSSPTRCWTWHWSRRGCSTRRPTSRQQARPTARAAWGCSAASRPHTQEALTLHNPSTAQGHWYLHQLLFLPRRAL